MFILINLLFRYKTEIMQKYAESPNFADDVVVTFLNLLLADEYVLYTKTRTAHWNVDGENYFETHLFLENQYNVLDLIIDDLAEQIRSLGHFALGSLKDFVSIDRRSDGNHDFVHSARIVGAVLIDQETIIRTI